MSQNDLVRVQERVELISTGLRPLYDMERRQAYDVASQAVAGPHVDESNYPEVKPPPPDPAEYPSWMVAMVVILCIVVLVAAGTLSLFRLYSAGYNVFCDSMIVFNDNQPRWQCHLAGASAVVMAEIGQTVALLAIAVLGQTSLEKRQKATLFANRIFWGIAFLTTMVAYVGNLHVAKPWNHMSEFFGAFAWILDLVPPTIVIGVMYALKELMLYYIQRRFTYLAALGEAKEKRYQRINEDRAVRQAWLASPENHPQWLRMYSLALRDALIRANDRQRGERKSRDLDGRIDLLKSLNNEEWKYLIKREMLADDFTVNPEHQTVVERAQIKIEERAQEQPELKALTALTDDKVEEIRDDIWQEKDGSWAFKSKFTGKIYDGYPSESVAKQKRYAHHYSYSRNHNLQKEG